MKILVLGMNYAPERTSIAPYTTELCETLVARGHQVTMATTFPHYPEWQVYSSYRGKLAAREILNGVQIHRTYVRLPKRSTMAQRVVYDSSLAAGTLWTGLTAGAVDFILAVEPPIQVGVAARLLSRKTGAPYALLIQDLALEAGASVGMMKSGAAFRFGRALEQFANARAAKMIVISQGFAENLGTKQVPADKIVVLPNWVDCEFVRPMPRENMFRKELGVGAEDLVILHAGNMGAKQKLETVVDAAELGRAHKDWRFVLVGDGATRNALMQRARDKALSNISFLPLQPKQTVPFMYGAADILVLHQAAEMVEAVAPSKLLSYMASGRPVVIAAHPNSEASRLVREAGCGLVVPAENPPALLDAIQSMAQDPARRVELGRTGRRYAESHFGRTEVLGQYVALIEGLGECDARHGRPYN